MVRPEGCGLDALDVWGLPVAAHKHGCLCDCHLVHAQVGQSLGVRAPLHILVLRAVHRVGDLSDADKLFFILSDTDELINEV